MKIPKFNIRLKEWHRTIILLLLLAFSIGFIIWSKNQYEVNFIDTF